MQSMALVRFLIAVAVAVVAAHVFVPQTAVWVMLGALVIWPGPLGVVRFLAGVLMIALAFGK